MDPRPSHWQEKVTTAERAVWHINSGDRVFVGTLCAAPSELVRALEDPLKPLKDIQMIHYLADDIYPLSEDGQLTTRYQHKVFYVGFGEERIIAQGKDQLIDYIPISISQVPDLFNTGRFPIDVALIQTTYPDENGFVSLGVSVDITKSAVTNAKMVIAEINPHMPWTRGDTFINVDRIDHMVKVDTPVKTYSQPKVDDDIAEPMARYIASIIDDGSTLQIGMGRYPNCVLKYLHKRKDLGIHSDIITDDIIDLIDQGIITGERKTHFKGRIVTSYCVGSERLYRLVDQNPMFSFHPIESVCDPINVSRNHKMVSVTQAWVIDLMGQVCSGQRDGRLYGGVSVQPDFIRGAASSPGGKPIICLESTYLQDGEMKSSIRSKLKAGEGVTISRSDVHYVVTEYGHAYLFAKSIPERALRLIQIAHPAFRDELLAEAKELKYLREDYVLESKGAYPEDEEREVTLKNEEDILIRPSKASDYRGIQDIFYALPQEDIGTRFFNRQMSSLPETKYNFLANVDYENDMAFVAVSGGREGGKIVGNALYSLDDSINLAECAYMIHPGWQSKRLGTALRQRMIEYAKSKGVRGLYEIFLADNEKMKRLAEKGENVTVTYSDGKGRAEMLF